MGTCVPSYKLKKHIKMCICFFILCAPTLEARICVWVYHYIVLLYSDALHRKLFKVEQVQFPPGTFCYLESYNLGIENNFLYYSTRFQFFSEYMVG